MAVRQLSKSNIKDGVKFNQVNKFNIFFEYLVIAGGGGGTSGAANFSASGGGGAGGYRTNVIGEISGANSVAETLFYPPSSFTVTVGAGGAVGVNGVNSVFASIISIGGGAGAYSINGTGNAGGSGGGGGAVRGVGISFQGNNGGISSGYNGAGGGGASTVGTLVGGAGLNSTITGTSVTRAGGGGGGTNGPSAGSAGGAGGGGAGSAGNANNAVAGTVNTGGGGGGGGQDLGARLGAAGGSGLVVLRYSDSITLTIDAGLTSTTSLASGFKTTIFTAGTGTVTF